VDPPDHNMEMKAKLLLPFSLLSDPRGDLARRYGVWNEREHVAIPAIVVVDRSGEIRYLYAGSDFADRAGDEEIFAALDDLEDANKEGMSGPEVRVSAPEAHDTSVRADKAAITLEKLVPYYRGVFFTTVALKRRFEGWGRTGRDAFEEVSRYQEMVKEYRAAIQETIELHENL
jgi:hypothetical protein